MPLLYIFTLPYFVNIVSFQTVSTLPSRYHLHLPPNPIHILHLHKSTDLYYLIVFFILTALIFVWYIIEAFQCESRYFLQGTDHIWITYRWTFLLVNPIKLGANWPIGKYFWYWKSHNTIIFPLKGILYTKHKSTSIILFRINFTAKIQK